MGKGKLTVLHSDWGAAACASNRGSLVSYGGGAAMLYFGYFVVFVIDCVVIAFVVITIQVSRDVEGIFDKSFLVHSSSGTSGAWIKTYCGCAAVVPV